MEGAMNRLAGPLQSVRVDRANSQTSGGWVSLRAPFNRIISSGTYGGLLLRSVFRMMGTRVISVTS